MKFLKPHNRSEATLFIYAFIVIPITSLLLGLQESIFYENLTYIGNQPQYRVAFQLWGTFISLNYFLSFYYLTKKTGIRKKGLLPIAFFIALCSILSFYIPYNTDKYPLLSNLHVYTSLVASLLTFILLAYYIHLFRFIHFDFYQTCLRILFRFFTLCAMLLLILGDISGILELVMAMFLSIFLYYMIASYNVHKTLT